LELYALVVPTGTDLSTFKDDVVIAIEKMQPLVLFKKSAEFENLYHGGLGIFLRGQIGKYGAGLVRSKIDFKEITG
jgi:hypothetical protein